MSDNLTVSFTKPPSSHNTRGLIETSIIIHAAILQILVGNSRLLPRAAQFTNAVPFPLVPQWRGGIDLCRWALGNSGGELRRRSDNGSCPPTRVRTKRTLLFRCKGVIGDDLRRWDVLPPDRALISNSGR